MILGLGQPVLAFFHLIIHAFFKSTLFMCAGFIIHNLKGRQDSRLSGLFGFRRPILGVVLGGTNLALCGFPFLAGFFSKDIILENSFSSSFRGFLFLRVLIATGLTVRYRLRLVYLRAAINTKINSINITRDFRYLLVFRVRSLFFLRVVRGSLLNWVVFLEGSVYILKTYEKFYIIIICLLRGLTFFFLIKTFFRGFYSKSIVINFSSLIRFIPFYRVSLRNPVFKKGKFRLKLLDKR